MCAAVADESGPEGLSSTSLLDLLLPTGLEPTDTEEPSEALAAGSGFPGDESEESRLLQPPQYFWEEVELNDSSVDLGPTADYVFPDLTEKAGSVEDSTQTQGLPGLPSPLPKLSLVEPPWHVAPDAEEEEELLPVNGPPEEAETQAQALGPPSSSAAPGGTGYRPEDTGDRASSGLEVESGLEPGPPPPMVSPRAETTGGREAGSTVLPATGLGVTLMAPQEASKGPAMGTASEQGDTSPSAPGQPKTMSEDHLDPRTPASQPEAAGEDRLDPRTPTSLPLGPRGAEPTPSSAASGQEQLGQQPEEGPAAEAQSRTPWDSTQVICKDWSNLAGKNYVILNMTENVDCEVFRQHRGLRLLALVEEVLPRHGHGPLGAWRISLSKPSDKERHLLMTLVGEQGVVPTQDVLSMLGDIRRRLAEIGIQSYSTASSCQARASQARSDYGTLFVVLVVIGAVCVVIIALGLLYNCWQRRLPTLKHVVSSGPGARCRPFLESKGAGPWCYPSSHSRACGALGR
ncbi:podocalyxin-like protein 2, partial [Tupaia chinensis]